MRMCYGCNKETTETKSFNYGPHLCFACRTDPYKMKAVNRINEAIDELKLFTSGLMLRARRYYSMTPSEQKDHAAQKAQIEEYRVAINKTLAHLEKLNSDH